MKKRDNSQRFYGLDILEAQGMRQLFSPSSAGAPVAVLEECPVAGCGYTPPDGPMFVYSRDNRSAFTFTCKKCGENGRSNTARLPKSLWALAGLC